MWKWPFLVLLVALLGLGWALELNLEFERAVARERARLIEHSRQPARPAAEPESLPPAILQYVTQSGALEVEGRWVQLHQEGEMRLKPEGPWVPFSARHFAILDRPGFVWEARMDMVPLVPVKVVDSYVDGQGRLEARMGGFYTVAREQGPDLALGELYRYFAELPWAPQALARQTGGQWSPTKGGWRLNFEADGHAGWIDFGLDEQGRLASITAQRPNRETDGSQTWVGRFSDYRNFGGVWLPQHGEVGWVVDGAERLYWRGRIISVKFGP